ncbi:maltose alpha-D-glucosyltransferase [Glaciimonas immobilis]|nr:maltose alpha-D-glucosyltransferase [Glaciimonas immobilis]
MQAPVAHTEIAAKLPTDATSVTHSQRFIDDPLWYKDAVIYQIHVKSYFDANNDGIGDFPGLIQKLDYIAALGVNTIWLLPFYPSPRRDDGYDISEYCGVHADYGSMEDTRRFIAEAHQRGLRVITELVINHTSDQHPWFQRARTAPAGSEERNFYVWSDNDQQYAGTRIIFLDTEKSNWTWDPVANAFFWHRFYSHQPDLNFDNPQVLAAVLEVMTFWLALGIDGLRLDAVPYLIEREGTSNENLAETHAILKLIRAELERKFPGRMLLAEANMWPEDVQQYFGDDDECHMAFHFPLMPRMFMALAQQDRFPMTDILRQTPDIPADCQWAIFLRNHDELTLEMVTDKERDYLWNFYAPDLRARINMGIRRRLAPLLERDRRRIELLNSFLLSMPGTPVIYYGDEIGMGDNVHLGDRDGVRTPMQWTPDRNGGFSRSDPAWLVLPTLMDSLYGYEAINVESQNADPHSLLNWTRRMLEVRKQHRAFGRGKLTLIYPNNRKIFAYLREYDDSDDGGIDETILCVANLSQSAQAVELDLATFAGRIPVEMLGGAAFPPIGRNSYLLTLPPYGFYWFALASEATMPSWYAPTQEPLPEYATLVFRGGVEDILKDPQRTILEKQALPAYLPKRRWYAGKQEKLRAVRIVSAVLLPPSEARPRALPLLLTELETETAAGVDRYMMPLGFIREENVVSALLQQLSLARVRRHRDVGLLTDAFTLDSLPYCIIEQMRVNATLTSAFGEVRFIATAALENIMIADDAVIRRMSTEQSNSSLVIDEKIVLKLLRRLFPGTHPEAEMGRYLTELGYANTPAMLGEVVATDTDGAVRTLMVLQRFIHNKGDAWEWVMDTMARLIQQIISVEAELVPDAATETAPDAMHELTDFSELLGVRLGELHAALARPSENAAFSPQIATATDIDGWKERVGQQLASALDLVTAKSDWPNEDTAREAASLLALRSRLVQLITRLAEAGIGTNLTRIHGDFHLGQVLMGQGDVYIVDFEGEPNRPMQQRREKASPWRDVAGLLRSLDYAAAFADNAGPGDLGAVAMERKRQFLGIFSPLCQSAFLDGYRSALQAADAQLPQATETALIGLFTLEKAAYEVCYEAANRPSWLPVPIHGMLLIAERLLDNITEVNAHD